MGSLETNPQGPATGVLDKTWSIVKEIWWQIGKWSFITILFIVLILGLTNVYDFVVGDGVPEVYPIGMGQERCLANRNSAVRQSLGFDPTTAWDDLRPSVVLLRKACPPAAIWVEERHALGKITWEDRYDRLAAYAPGTGHLFISSSLFQVNDGTRASVLAHEYRHSRQTISKHMRRLICTAFFGDQDWMVEDEARLFEKEVYLAIFD